MNVSFLKPSLLYTAFCGVILYSALSLPVYAQNLPTLSKKDPLPEDYVSEPIYYKGLIIEPKLNIGSFYNDNIYAADVNEVSDFIATIAPSLKVTKEYGSAVMVGALSGNLERYKNTSRENRSGYQAALSYQNDFSPFWTVATGVSYQSQPRNRQDPTGLSASLEPLNIDTFSALTSITRRFNRLSLTLKGQYDSIVNENGLSLLNPAQNVKFSQNDRDQYTGTAILQYDLVPGGDLGTLPLHAVYTSFSHAKHDYEEQATTTLTRDRFRLSGLLGYIGTFKNLNLSTNFGFGFTKQNFDESSVEDTTDLTYFAKLQYKPGEKHTLFFDALRDVTSDSLFLEGITETNFNLSSDYELQHNLYLNSRLGYEINDFESGREDQDKILGASLRYIFSPRLEGQAGATFTRRESSDISSDFDQTVFMLRLNGKL